MIGTMKELTQFRPETAQNFAGFCGQLHTKLARSTPTRQHNNMLGKNFGDFLTEKHRGRWLLFNQRQTTTNPTFDITMPANKRKNQNG